MASTSQAFRCSCFFTHNYFSRLLQGHFRYVDEATFLRDYGERLGLNRKTNSFSKLPIDRGFEGNSRNNADDAAAVSTDAPLTSGISVNDVIKELEEELERRESLAEEINRRKAAIASGYSPKHAVVYRLREEEFLAPEFLRLAQTCRDAVDPESILHDASLDIRRQKSNYAPIFSFPVFTDEFCSLLLDELSHFEKSELPKGRPNTMNRRGVLLNELLNFEDGFVDVLRRHYVQPIVEKLLPGE